MYEWRYYTIPGKPGTPWAYQKATKPQTVEVPPGKPAPAAAVAAVEPVWRPQEHLLEIGGLVLAVAVAKAIREQGMGAVTEKLRDLLHNPVLVQAVRSAGNVLSSIVQSAAANRIAAFGGLSLTALVLQQIRAIPKGSAAWFIAGLGVVTGGELVVEGLESIQGIMPFSSVKTTDTDFPTTVVFSQEHGELPDRMPGLRQFMAQARAVEPVERG